MGYQLRIEKVKALPAAASRTTSTLYIVKADAATEVELWVTANTGTPPVTTRVGAGTAGDYISRLEAKKADFRSESNLVSYQTNASVTGALVFVPPATSDVMNHLVFEGNNYQANGNMINLNVNGYWYNTGKTWHNPSAKQLGNMPLNVRLGKRNSDNRAVIILGDTNTVWDYPSVCLTHAVISDVGATDAYMTGWTVTRETSFSPYTIQRTIAAEIAATKTDLANYIPRSEAEKINFVTAHNLVSYQNNLTPVIGAIVFQPASADKDVMHRLSFMGYSYDNPDTKILDLEFAGYWWPVDDTWYRCQAKHNGTLKVPVRVARDTTTNIPAIILGDVNTQWEFPSVSIINAVLSFTDANANYTKGWTAKLVTSFSNYQIQQNLPVVSDASSSDLVNYTPKLEADRTSFRMASDMVSYNAFGTVVGAIAFLAPASMSYCMMQLSFRGFTYQEAQNDIHFDFTGYWYEANNIWVGSSVVHLGDKVVPVRTAMRTSDGRPAIIIGNAGQSWTYPMIGIVSAMLSNDGANATTLKGWTTELIADFSAYGSSVGVVPTGNNVAGKLATAREIEITGEVVGRANFDGSQNISISVMPATSRFPEYNPIVISDVLPTTAKVNWSIKNLRGYFADGLRFTLYLTDVTNNTAETSVTEFPFEPTNRYSHTLTGLVSGRTYRVRISASDALSPDSYYSNLQSVQFTTASVIADANSEIKLLGTTMTNTNIQLLDVDMRGYKSNIGITDNELSTFVYSQNGGEADWKKAQMIAEIEPRPLPVTYADNNRIRIVKSPVNQIKPGDRLLVRVGEDVEVVTAKVVTDINTGKHRDKPWRYAVDEYYSRDWNTSFAETESPQFLPTNRYESTAVKLGNYIYIMGGTDGTTQYTTTVRIVLTPGGLIDYIETMPSTANLPVALSSAMSWVIGPYVYVAGGYNGTTRQTKVYRAEPDLYGNISAWVEQSNSPLSTAISNAAVAVYGGYVWIVGGKTAAATWTSNSMSAKINTDGTIGRFAANATGYTNSVSDFEIIVKDGKMFGFGGRSSATAGITNIYMTEIMENGELAPWRLNYVAYSTANHDLRVLSLGEDVVILGGYLNTTPRSARQYMPYTREAGMDGLGTIATCSATGYAASGAHVFLTGSLMISISNFAATTNKIYTKPLEVPIYQSTEIIEQDIVFDRPVPVASSVVYRDGREFMAAVGAAITDIAGSTGPWWRDNPYSDLVNVPSGPAIAVAPGVTWTRDAIAMNSNYVVSFGGIDGSSGTPMTTIRNATVSPDGVLSAWTNRTNLPKAAYDQVAIPVGQGIYLIGGMMSQGRSQYMIRVTFGLSGTVATPVLSTSLPRALNQHDAFVHGKYIYVIGGETNAEVMLSGPNALTNATAYALANNVRYVTLRGKGAPGTAGAAGAASTVVYNGITYTFAGGAINQPANTTVHSVPVHPDYGTTITPTIPAGGSMTAEHYSTADSMNNNIYRIQLDASGTVVGGWELAGTMPSPRAGFETVVYKDKIFIIGGYHKSGSTFSFPDTILTASVSEAGGVSGWDETASYPWNVGACYALVRSGRRAYLVGGYNGSGYHLNVRTIDFEEPAPKVTITGSSVGAGSYTAHLGAVVTRYAALFFGGKNFLTTDASFNSGGVRYNFCHWRHTTNSATINREKAQYITPSEYRFRDGVLTLTSPVFDVAGSKAIWGMRLKAYDALTSLNVKLWN